MPAASSRAASLSQAAMSSTSIHGCLRSMKGRALFAAALGAALAAGCVAPVRETAAPAVRPRTPLQEPGYAAGGLESVMGQNARALIALFGNPDLDDREGPARKLQFLRPACVLDAYLYPPRARAEPVVTHVDARPPRRRGIHRASC